MMNTVDESIQLNNSVKLNLSLLTKIGKTRVIPDSEGNKRAKALKTYL